MMLPTRPSLKSIVNLDTREELIKDFIKNMFPISSWMGNM